MYSMSLTLTKKPFIYLLDLKNFSILEQLKIEEALLRLDQRNVCLLNEGSPKSIVLGISSKPEELVDVELAKEKSIPIIRRFSGGGGVIVNEHTLFVSFIFSKNILSLPSFFPESILKWSESFYQSALQMEAFQLRENDFVIGMKKCGGNAQYIKKDRWIHHTTFLWDYHAEDMALLHLPKKIPKYRENRSHDAFLYRLKELFPERNTFLEKVRNELSKRFHVIALQLDEAKRFCTLPHRTSTTLII